MKIKIEQNKSQCELDTTGGRICLLQLQNKPVLGTFDRIDGKKGNTHLCTPNFGAEGKEMGLPFHGPSRNEVWNTIKQTTSEVVLSYTMQLTGDYPGGLEYKQTFTLHTNSFTHTISVKNNSLADLPMNLGIHNYWFTKKGWTGTKINGKEVTAEIQKNGSASLLPINKIELPGQIPIQLAVDGFQDAVLWTGFVGDRYDSSYVCIEPVRSAKKGFFGSKESILKKKEKQVFSQKIRLISS